MYFVPLSRRSSFGARHFDRLLDASLDRFFAPAAAAECSASPALDVVESAASFTIQIDLPGLSKEDVKVAIEGRQVNIQAQAAAQDDDSSNGQLLRRERKPVRFERSLRLPVELDQAASSASMSHGVLTLTLAKHQAAKPTELTIN